MNTYLQKTAKIVDWTVAIGIAVASLVYCLLGVWRRGLLGFGIAFVVAPPIGAHPYVRLGAIIFGMLIL